jgi:hypothetical protein
MQVSVLKGRMAVCNCSFASPHYVFLTRPTGQLDPALPLGLGLGRATFGAFWLWEGAVRTEPLPNALPTYR